jgi:AAA domain (dynein-related subfamily)
MNAHVRLSKHQRSALRSAVVANPGWSNYRQMHGLSIATITAEQLQDAAIALGVNIAEASNAPNTFRPNHNFAPKPRPWNQDQVLALSNRFTALVESDKISAKDIGFCESVFLTVATKQDGYATDGQYLAVKAILDRAENIETPAPAPSPVPHVAPAASNDAAGQLAALIGQLAGQSVSPEQIARIVDERITAALASVPSIRIECKGHDAQIRQISGHQHPAFRDLLTVATSRQANGFVPNIWLAGPAGSGKTHSASMVADALGLPFRTNGAVGQQYELVGFIDAGGTYHRTPFRDAFEHGGVYCFDEIDASANDAILPLNPAMANNQLAFPDGMVARHKDCIIIGTANTWGLGATADYVGRAKLDGAILSRFAVKIDWQYDTALEVAISGNETFARRVIAARERARNAGLKVIIDPRASQAGAALIAAGMKQDDAARLTYLANLSVEQRKIVEGN